MKIKKPRKNKKLLIISAVVLVALAAAGGTWYFLTQNNDTNDTNDTHDTEINKIEKESDDSSNDSDDTSSSDLSEEAPAAETPSEEGVDSSVQQDGEVIQRGDGNTGAQSVTISRLDASASSVTLVALVHGATEGTCNVTFSQQGRGNVTGSAPIQTGPTYYACQIDIARGQFPAGGTWQAQVSVNNARANSEISL
ncbi:MAG: hypothetical protein ACTJG2_04315 [Candidatus Saccharimonadales bacterium]